MTAVQTFTTSWLGWDQTNERLVFWDGSTWRYFEEAAGVATNADLEAGLDTRVPLTGGNMLGPLGVGGATADETNQLAVSSEAVLFNHAGSGVQTKLNKHGSGDDAAYLFQTDFSTRALIGLLGDDDFTFKVSPDGSSFFISLVIDKDTGQAGFEQPFGVHGGPASPSIASDAITITKSYVVPQPESGTSDNLSTIDGGFDGALLVISGTAGNSITLKDGTGNLKLAGDCLLDNFEDTITLIKRGTDWLELARSNNG